MEKLTAKLLTLGALMVLTITFSVIPYFLVLRGSRSLVAGRRRDKVMALLNCFGGGVFLGTLLLHLFSEGSDEFDDYKAKVGWTSDFPLFNIFVACGFFVVAFLELFMHSHLHGKNSHQTQSPASAEESQGFQGQYGAVGSQKRQLNSGTTLLTSNQIEENTDTEHNEAESLLSGRHNHHSCDSARSLCVPVDHKKLPGDHGYQNCHVNIKTSSDSVGQAADSVAGISDVIAEIPDGLRAFLLLVALSFHTIFDGLAVGLQETVSEIWQVFAAIAIHKSIIAFCLGLELFKCHPHNPWKAFAWICFFSFMSPVGIGLGIGLTSGGINEVAKLLSSSILQGLAAGTFLYVTFLEILSLYIGHNCQRQFGHVFCALLGFAFMACVKLLDRD